ncbi:MAG TPA: zonular occludens toxin domain-containing protein [Opitutus sp.]|nr:zonular occludens toxin domain-containing protein [Opitutus sp.]
MNWLPEEGAIWLISGELGSGKTAAGVELAYDLLSIGGWVFTNVKIYVEAIRDRLASEGLEFAEERLVFLQGRNMREFYWQLKRGEAGCPVMALVDEADLDWNARNTHDKEKRPTEEFLNLIKMARKLDIWFVFVAQDGLDMDSQVRRKFTVEVVCRSLKHEQIFGIPCPIPAYVRIRWKVYRGLAHHKIGAPEWFFHLRAWGLFESKALLGEKAEDFAKFGQARRTRLKKIERTAKGFTWVHGLAAAVVVILCVW